MFLVCPNSIICLPVKKRLKARQDGAPRAIEEVASAARPRPPAMRAAACLRVRGLRRSLRRSVRRSVRLRRRVEGGGRGARLEAPTWLGFGVGVGVGLGFGLGLEYEGAAHAPQPCERGFLLQPPLHRRRHVPAV